MTYYCICNNKTYNLHPGYRSGPNPRLYRYQDAKGILTKWSKYRSITDLEIIPVELWKGTR